MKRATMALLAGAAICTALAAIYFHSGGAMPVSAADGLEAPSPPVAGGPAPVTAPGVAASKAVPELPASGTSTKPPGVASLPAWMSGPPAVTAPATAFPARTPDLPHAGASNPRMDAAIKRLQELQSSNVTDPKQVNDAILQVERANGSPVLEGIRLDVLRHNLQIAERMKTISESLQASSGNPLSPTSAGAAPNAAQQRQLDELETLRKQLRTDVLEPGSSLARAIR